MPHVVLSRSNVFVVFDFIMLDPISGQKKIHMRRFIQGTYDVTTKPLGSLRYQKALDVKKKSTPNKWPTKSCCLFKVIFFTDLFTKVNHNLFTTICGSFFLDDFFQAPNNPKNPATKIEGEGVGGEKSLTPGKSSWEPKGNPTPPMPRKTPQEIAGLMIRDYENPLALGRAPLNYQEHHDEFMSPWWLKNAQPGGCFPSHDFQWWKYPLGFTIT